jgi:hypothetical protein
MSGTNGIALGIITLGSLLAGGILYLAAALGIKFIRGPGLLGQLDRIVAGAVFLIALLISGTVFLYAH